MLRATSSKLNRLALAAIVAALLVPAVLASPAGAQTGGSSPAYGGTTYALRAYIYRVTCMTNCAARASTSTVAPVGAKPDSLIKVIGRNMSGVRTVIFTGRYGTADDVRVIPKAVGRMSVDVVVPSRANSGRVVLYTPTRLYSYPSRQIVTIAQSPISPQGLIWPSASRMVTSPFGEDRGDHFHAGIDIAMPIGTYLHSAASGRVIMASAQGGYGNYVCVAHATLSTCYAHLSQFLVSVGQTVAQNQIIGRAGCTGNCTGPHLHYEVRTGTQPWAPVVDPLRYLPAGARMSSAPSDHEAMDYDLPVYGS